MKTRQTMRCGVVAILIMLAFGMTVVGCGDGSGDGDGGTFTLTGIPSQYNGKWAVLEGGNNNDLYLMGAQSINYSAGTAAGVPISGGKASFPMWAVSDDDKIIGYSGNDSNVEVLVSIMNTATYNFQDYNFSAERYFEPVTFSKGSATKAWNDGEDFEGHGEEAEPAEPPALPDYP